MTELTSAEDNKVSESVTASRWFYYSVPADSDSFEITVSSDLDVSVYIRKGATDLPDTVNFDAVIKNSNQITMPSSLLASEDGWMVAIHCQQESTDATTNFSIRIDRYTGRAAIDTIDFLDLAAAPAMPAPMPPLPAGKKNGPNGYGEPVDDLSSISNLQYVLLGALLGCLATVLFY